MKTSWAKWLCLASLGGLVVVAGLIAFMAVPSSEAVRLRNAFLIEAGRAGDFDWTPNDRPSDFRWEHEPATARFQAAVETIRDEPGDAFVQAKSLAAQLLKNANDGGAIQRGLDETYRRITEDGTGYCADFVRVFLAMAHAAGIPARQWAFSFDGFGGHGHTFPEIFDIRTGRWLMLDVFSNLYPVSASGQPLSALEFRQVLLDSSATVRLRRISYGRLEFPIEEKAIEYYRRGAAEWYLWWGNDVFSYERHPAVRFGAVLGRGGEQLAALLAGVYPKFKVLDAQRHVAQIQRMAQLRQELILLGCAAIVLSLAAALSGALWWRRGRQRT